MPKFFSPLRKFSSKICTIKQLQGIEIPSFYSGMLELELLCQPRNKVCLFNQYSCCYSYLALSQTAQLK